MGSRFRIALLVALLVIPSALFVWLNSDVPKFCDLHDDCLYFVSAKSLTDGGGYRIPSLPGEPPQTKYPPLYPLLLSVAWRITPSFPENLTPAVWLSWLALPFLLFQWGQLLPRMGFPGWKRFALMAAVALNPYTLNFSGTLLSELLFTGMLLGALVLLDSVESEEKNLWAAALSGILLGLAYLSRSAGIVALGSVPLLLLWNRRPKQATFFVAGMLPFVAGWMVWVKLHQTPTSDPALMYYVDYFRYQLYNVRMEDLPVLLGKNLDGLLYALGSLVLPRVTESFFLKIVSELIAVGMISGIVRMVRTGKARAYALFALGSSVLLVIWHFPPNERFVYPMLPLALAGLFTEMQHLVGMLRAGFRHQDSGQRVAARLLATTVVAGALASIGLQLFVDAVYLPQDSRQYRLKRDAQLQAFAWLKQQTPANANLLATRDPLVYLRTGRHAMSRPIPPMHWYHEDRDAVVDSFRTVAPFARAHQLQYVYYAGVDFGWSVDEEDKTAIDRAVHTNPELETAFQQGVATVYGIQQNPVVAGN